jgi:hypothetical protein
MSFSSWDLCSVLEDTGSIFTPSRACTHRKVSDLEGKTSSRNKHILTVAS